MAFYLPGDHCSAKLPKWCGERPGKKATDPASPEEEEEDIKTAVGEEIEEIGNIEDEGDEEDEEAEEDEEEDEYEYE